MPAHQWQWHTSPFDSSARRARASTSPLTHADVKFLGGFKVIGGDRGGMVGTVAVRHSRPGNGHRQQTMHRDTLNPLKRVSFLLNHTVHGHAPGSPRKHPAVLDSVLYQDNADRTNPADGPCPGYYYAGDFPDGDT